VNEISMTLYVIDGFFFEFQAWLVSTKIIPVGKTITL